MIDDHSSSSMQPGGQLPPIQDRRQFAAAIREHDWDYNFSDSPGRWWAGDRLHRHLEQARQLLGCPHTLETIQAWARGRVLEHYREVGSDEWQLRPENRGPDEGRNCRLRDLLTQAQWQQVQAWMDERV